MTVAVVPRAPVGSATLDGNAPSLAAAALGAEVVEHHENRPRRFDRAMVTVDATGHPDGLA